MARHTPAPITLGVMAIDSDLLSRLANPGVVGRTESDIQSDIKMLLLSATDLSPVETALASLVNFDIKIGHRAKRSHGKGYRAFFNTIVVLPLPLRQLTASRTAVVRS